MLVTARPSAQTSRRSASAAAALLSVGVAACLAIDAYVHLKDASDYSAVRTSVLSQADLFRVQAGLAIAAALLLLVRPRLWTWAAAGVLAAGAAVAVVLYTSVDVGRLGPVPDMYEPTWALPGKVASAWAEGVGAVLALVGFVLAVRRRRRIT
jgi:hypothetical protein